jgi:hypothetical protein
MDALSEVLSVVGEAERADWERLCAVLDALEGAELERAVEVALPVVELWDVHTRSAPEAWLAACAERGVEPRMRLISHLSLAKHNRVLGEGLLRFLGSPSLTGLAQLVLNVGLDATQLEALAGNAALLNLRRLSLRRTPLSVAQIELLAASEGLAGLESLSLHDAPIGEDGALALAESGMLARMTDLGISGDPLGARACEALLRAAPLLTNLTLDDVGLDAAGALHLLNTPLQNPLEVLHLSRARLDDTHVPALLAWGGLSGLRVLDLSDNGFTGDGFLALCASGQLDGLECLRMRGCPLGPVAFPERLRALTVLNLSRCGLGDVGVAALAATRGDEAFMSLSLDENGITAAGVRALVSGPRCAGVRFFHLSKNPLGDDGFIVLAAWEGLSAVSSFVAERCGVGDVGVQALFNSPHLGVLNHLFLLYNNITDVGAAAIAASPVGATLDGLILYENPITAVGWGALADSPMMPDAIREDAARCRDRA